MKKTLTTLIISWLLLTWITIVDASSFDAVNNNCLFINNKYFDSCPKYRKQVKIINEVLYDIRVTKEKEVLGKNEMLTEVEDMQNKLKLVNAKLFKSGQRTEDKAFYIGYMIEIMDLYMFELETAGKVEGKAEELFTKTYFNENQEWLVINDIKLQSDAQRVLQFDEKLHLEIDMRNFMLEAVTQVEDIYCFASIWAEDYIFPLDSPVNLFEANSIKTINISMNTNNHPLMDTVGEQTIYCNMVYFDDNNNEIITPYKEFTFTVQEA